VASVLKVSCLTTQGSSVELGRLAIGESISVWHTSALARFVLLIRPASVVFYNIRPRTYHALVQGKVMSKVSLVVLELTLFVMFRRFSGNLHHLPYRSHSDLKHARQCSALPKRSAETADVRHGKLSIVIYS